MTFPAIYTPHHKGRVLRVAGLRLVEAGMFAVAFATGAACYGAERIGLHRSAERLAVLLDSATDLTDRVSDRINELGGIGPHPWLLALYRWLGGEALDARLAAMIENDDPQHPGPKLTPEELAKVEAAYPAELLDTGSVYADPVSAVTQAGDDTVTEEDLDRAEAELFARFEDLLDKRHPAAEGAGSGEAGGNDRG